jgi:3-phosphoglycerate kinase
MLTEERNTQSFKNLDYGVGATFDGNQTPPIQIDHTEELFGLVLNLEEESVRVIVLGDAGLVRDGRTIVDCGKETLTLLDVEIERAHTVIMNGPLGLYEQGWLHGTEHVLSQMGTRPRSITYIGGGDTVTAAHKIGALKKIGFVSLGGGAMLDYLASGTLPGIDAVTKSH